MVIELPSSHKLPIGTLSGVFSNTTNSYKFYWFLAILDEIESNRSKIIPFDRLFMRMLSEVIYPLEFYRLSFGKADSFRELGNVLRQKMDFDFRPAAKPISEQIEHVLDDKDRNVFTGKVKILNRWVPYRFIRPFFAQETKGLPDSSVNSAIQKLALEAGRTEPFRCPYTFSEEAITLSEPWFEYFQANIGILRAFVQWHLVCFLQVNNPNVVGIPFKLCKPTARNMTMYINSWRSFFEKEGAVNCIYSKEVIPESFTLDHFIPWSFVVADNSWNLVPTSKKINSSKSDNLPDLKYLKLFTDLQFRYFDFIQQSRTEKILEEYCLMFKCSNHELRQIQPETFSDTLSNAIKPLIQIAANNGFSQDWTYEPDRNQTIVYRPLMEIDFPRYQG